MIASIASHQTMRTGGCIPPHHNDEHAAEVRDLYDGAILKLPGVTGVGGKNELAIYTRSEQDSSFLKNMLRSDIQGVPVHYYVTGDIKAQAAQAQADAPPVANPQDVLQKYGSALRSLPHVVKVSVMQRSVGPSTPAFRNDLVVKVGQPQDMHYVADLVNDSIEGVRVHVEPTSCFGF